MLLMLLYCLLHLLYPIYYWICFLRFIFRPFTWSTYLLSHVVFNSVYYYYKLIFPSPRWPDCVRPVSIPVDPSTASQQPPPLLSSSGAFCHLPDLCMIAIFRQLPLRDQLIVQNISKRWFHLVSAATQTKRQLVIFIGKYRETSGPTKYSAWSYFPYWYSACYNFSEHQPQFNQWNMLHFEYLNEGIIERISTNFASIRKLHLIIRDVPDHWPIRLLERWHQQLTTFHLVEQFCKNELEPIVEPLYAAINSLSAVKHLTLVLRSLPHRDLPIVSQLTQLHFQSTCTSHHQFVQLLERHAGDANRCQLSQISYWRKPWLVEDEEPFFSSCDNVVKLCSLSDHLRHRFTKLNLCINFSLNVHAAFLDHFPSLSCLNIVIPQNSTLHSTFRRLSKLNQLTDLNLFLSLQITVFDAPADADREGQLLPQIKAVKKLTLILSLTYHQDVARLNIARTFPNVEVIDFVYTLTYSIALHWFPCGDCLIRGLTLGRVNRYKIKRCASAMYLPLKRDCTKLRTIRHSVDEWHGTAEAILAQSWLEQLLHSLANGQVHSFTDEYEYGIAYL